MTMKTKFPPYVSPKELRVVTLKVDQSFTFGDVSIIVKAGTKLKITNNKHVRGANNTPMWRIKPTLNYFIRQDDIINQPDIYEFYF